MPQSTPQQQQGIAILTALLVMAVAVMIAAAVITTQHFDVRIHSNVQQLERAYQYVSGVEQTAGIWLQRDLKKNQMDSLQDDWAIELPEMPIKEGETIVGSFSGKIDDLQGLFNLNNLVNPKNGKTIYWAQKLLTDLANTHQIPSIFVLSISDWIDKDAILTSPDSAEADYYLTQTKPYLAANTPLVDARELYLIRYDSFDPEAKTKALNALLTEVTALPKATKININTAPESLLKALLPTQAATIMTTRQQQPYDQNTLASLLSSLGELPHPTGYKPPDPKTNPPPEPTWADVLGVQSHYFKLQGLIKIGNARLNTHSLLERTTTGDIHILMRRFEYTTQPSAKTNEPI